VRVDEKLAESRKLTGFCFFSWRQVGARGNRFLPAEIPHGVFWRDATGQGCGLGSFVCGRERRDDGRGKNAHVEGDGEAVAVRVHGDSPFEKGAVAGRFDVVGECARVLQDGLKVEE
jgi:hypothetical protein